MNKRRLERGIAGLVVVALVLSMVPMVAMPALAAPSELFFSEYIEGSSNNKALEIFNGTGVAIDLAAGGYSVQMFFNGSTTAGLTLNLTGTVADGDVYVVAQASAVADILAQADLTSGAGFFNGDDAVVLRKGEVIIDAIGQIGVDPGDYWGSGDLTTQNHTLRRKGTIEAGDTDGSDPFDPAIEWDGYPIDTFDGLGTHSTGGPDYTPIYDIQYTEDPSGDSPYLGQEVTTEGIVTAVLSTGYWIEDPAGGAWSGLWVYDSNGPILGDRLRVTGVVDEYYDFTELKDLTGYEVVSSGNPLPDPVVVSTGAVSDEPYESVLVRVENVTVTNADLGYGEWSVSDGSGDVVIDDKGSYTYEPVDGDTLYAVIGLLEYSYGAFKMQPRDDNDIVFPPSSIPIYDIQYTEDPSGDSPYLGQEVTTEGIVTAVLSTGYWIEDPAGGAWSGLWVYDSNVPILGDLLQLTGVVDEYYDFTELKDLTGYEVVSSGNPLPDPVVVSTGTVSDEPYESVLVRVENVTVTNADLGYGEWSVSDGSGDVVIDDKGSYTYVPTFGDSLAAVIGLLEYSYGAFKMQPRDDADIIFGLDYTPIYDIQFTEDPSGDSPYLGQEVTTEGIVTAVLSTGYWIEDPAGGAWSGLWVYDSNGPILGDRLRVTGVVDEYYDFTELKDLTGYEVVSSGNPLPDPVVVSTGAVSDEPYESVLVRVENVTVTNADLGYGEWSVSDGSGDVVIDDKGSYTYEPVDGDTLYAVIGPLEYSYGAFKMQPRDDGDILQTEPLPPLVINEFLADPAGDLTGDANGDGVRDSSQDEFVEIVNNSDADLDISGWTLADGYSVRHTFPAGTVVSAQCAIVVFGGGAPTGAFGGAVVQTASTGTLGLNNSGDTIILNDGSTDQAVVAYGAEGGYDQSLTRDPDITGSFAQHSTATGSDGALFSPGTQIDGSSFAGCSMPEGCGDPYTHIYEIQGDGLVSPLVGAQVSVEGIVVGDFQNNASEDDGDLAGFHIQDLVDDGESATSNGLFVYDGYSPAVDVNVGDLIRVRGPVSEYNGLTEITVSQLWVCSTGNEPPAPTELSLPVTNLDDFEAYEGMLVTFPQALVISEYYNYDYRGEIVLSSERLNTPTAVVEPGPDAVALAAANALDRITLDDGRTTSNPDPALHPNGEVFDLDNLFRGGDTLTNVTGVVDYYYGYRIQPTQGADYDATVNPRTEFPDGVGSNLKVASFNVLNYFTTIDTGDWICGPSGDMECRGADTTEEFERQRAKIIAALQKIDADVVGLIEIENHPENVPVADLVDGLNEAIGATAYAYVATGPIGTDAIRQAFIYKPATVSLVGEYAVLDSSVDSRFIDTKNRPVLAQTFIDNATGGIFTVAVNHLKSKGSSCADIGDPDLGDGAGNCNLTRLAAAEALVDWLEGDPTGSGDSDFLIIGDLNSYDKEDPIDAILAGGYTDLAYSFLGEEAYSYVFDGQVGYLDYALASAGLLGEIPGATIWHINADEPDLIDYDMSYKKDAQDAIFAPDAYRASDHDPVIAGLDVCDEIAPTAEVWLTRDVLWPPNHKYVTVRAHVDAVDNFDPDPTVSLLSVTSNEPDNGQGDGDMPDDIVIVNDFVFKLRAERTGGGGDRIYTITYQVADDCGNVTYVTATVTVVHDLRAAR